MSLKIFFHNVGHGQSVHAFTPNGQTVVIDLGCSDEFSPLEWLKSTTDTIDILIITHPHGDHIDEILELENNGLKVRQFWRPKWLNEADVRNANQKNYEEKLDCYFSISNEKFTHPIQEKDLVGNPEVSGGVSIKKFASSDCGTSNINNHSGVVVFEYNGVKVVIPGDNEPASWVALLKQPSFVEAVTGAHLFMASHHGRESGFSSDLMKIMNPNLCIVSDGRVQDTDATNRYSSQASGWEVNYKSNGNSKTRNCLTTRTDGYIEVEIGRNQNNSAFLSVSKQ